jgi:hypothetical protein
VEVHTFERCILRSLFMIFLLQTIIFRSTDFQIDSHETYLFSINVIQLHEESLGKIINKSTTIYLKHKQKIQSI